MAVVTLSPLQKCEQAILKDTPKAQKEASTFVESLLDQTEESSPAVREGTSVARILALAEGFQKTVNENLSDGDVASCFGHLILGSIGSSRKLSLWQRRLIQSACSTIRRRPLPALRWSEWVLANMDDPDLIRYVLTACRRSKWDLPEQLSGAMLKSWNRTGLPASPRILAVGYSKTVMSIIEGMNARLSPQLFATSELLVRELKPKRASLVSSEQAAALCRTKQVDMILSGCKVIGRIDETKLEVVNSKSCVDLCKEAHALGIIVVVVAGLYKIWPKHFYRDHRSEIQLEAHDGQVANGVLRQTEIDWILTELGLCPARDFGSLQTARPYFEVENISVSSTLAACVGDRSFKLSQARINDILKGLSEEDEARDGHLKTIDEETYRYRRKGELPQHFLGAQEYFQRMLRDEQWYQQYAGRYVAIMGTNPPELEADDNLSSLMKTAYKRWGYRPIFMARVHRGEAPKLVIRPRIVVR